MEVKKLKRLVSCLELMGSDQDGEALNAARMAHKIVKEHKLAWADIIKVVISTPAPTINNPPPQPRPQPAAQQHPMSGMGGFSNQDPLSAYYQAQYYNQQHAQQQAYARQRMYEHMRAQQNTYHAPPPPPPEPPKETSAFEDFSEKHTQKRKKFGLF